jgi:hypothetical protein
MRIVSTALLTATFLGSAVAPGWCPQPATTTASIGSSNGATGAVVYRPPPPPKPLDFKTMTNQQRSQYLSREMAAGRVKGKEEMKNFLRTGDPKTPYTGPASTPPKPPTQPTKPASMSQATWDRIQAYRAQTAPQPTTPRANAAMDRLQGM